MNIVQRPDGVGHEVRWLPFTDLSSEQILSSITYDNLDALDEGLQTWMHGFRARVALVATSGSHLELTLALAELSAFTTMWNHSLCLRDELTPVIDTNA